MERPFAQLVSLACHDLRTPLATIHGFARTLIRRDDLGHPVDRYIGMIDAASEQMAELLDALAVVARIEDGRYDPARQDVDTAGLARAAAERLGPERVTTGGSGALVAVDSQASTRAVAAFAECALRHGGLERVDVTAHGPELAVSPVSEAVAPIILGDELRDLGAAVSRRVVEALGGSLELAGETLRIRLPPASAG